MAPYSTNANLEQAVGGNARLVQLTDIDGDRVVDQSVIDAAIVSADRFIDSYINKQVLVPLVAPIPQTIVDISARVAKYRILSGKGLLDQATIDEHTLDVAWLTGVSKGDIMIGVDPQPVKASARIDGSTARPSTKDVSRSKMRGFS